MHRKIRLRRPHRPRVGRPVVVGVELLLVLRVVADLVFQSDVRDPAEERVEARAVAQETVLAERAVEVDLYGGVSWKTK